MRDYTLHTEPGMSVPMNGPTKFKLVSAAKAVHAYLHAKGSIDPEETEEAFRRRMAIQACGRRISEALNGDYNLIMAALKSAMGDVKGALHHADRHGTDPKRIALNKLTEVLAAQGRNIGYAIPFLKRTRHVTLESATAKDIWAAFCRFNGGNKAAARRTKNWKQRTKPDFSLSAEDGKKPRKQRTTELSQIPVPSDDEDLPF